MGIFERTPYTNFHDINLDWVLEKVKHIASKFDKLRSDVDGYTASIAQNKRDIEALGQTDSRLEYNISSLNTRAGRIEQTQATDRDTINARITAGLTAQETVNSEVNRRLDAQDVINDDLREAIEQAGGGGGGYCYIATDVVSENGVGVVSAAMPISSELYVERLLAGIPQSILIESDPGLYGLFNLLGFAREEGAPAVVILGDSADPSGSTFIFIENAIIREG